MMNRGFVFKLLPTFLGVFFTCTVSAQLLPKIAVAAGIGIISLGKKGKNAKNNTAANNNNTNNNNTTTPNKGKGVAYIDTSKSYDLSGKWEGFQFNGQLIMQYQVCLTKIGKNMYSGTDYCKWLRNSSNTPLVYKGTEPPNSKKTFVGEFKGDMFSFGEISETGNSNWGFLNEKFRLITNNDSLAFINSDGNQSARKFYLKRTGDYPDEDSKYVFNITSLKIDTVTYHNPNPASIKYNDKGYLELSVNNKTANSFNNVAINISTDETENGIDGSDIGSHPFNIGPNSLQTLRIGLSTNLMVPNDFIHFNVIISTNGVPLAVKHFKIPTTSFFKTTKVNVPSYTSARMRAVSGYYGFLSNPYAGVGLKLEPLVASGDKTAAMWKAVFHYMGYGGYKIDENLGFAAAKTCIKHIEENARNGDAEALYLMYYACAMGLEGEKGKRFAEDFLKRAADGDFKPAVYDYAMLMFDRKDYATCSTLLDKNLDMGVMKAAVTKGLLYEKGYQVDKDISKAILWYKKGINFGDPDALLKYAILYSKGDDDIAPDINKSLSLATLSASKNCTNAMYFIGNIYFEGGYGKAKNGPLALKWFKEGAEQGNRRCMFGLGAIYYEGLPGLIKDQRSSFFWVKRAAEHGESTSMYALANYYSKGIGAEKDLIKERYWSNQAVINGVGQRDAVNAGANDMLNILRDGDFSDQEFIIRGGPRDGEIINEGPDLLGGLFSGFIQSYMSRRMNTQEQINGIEYIQTKNGVKIYGGTVTSQFRSDLNLIKGQTINIKAYGQVSLGFGLAPSSANGLNNQMTFIDYSIYSIVRSITHGAVMVGMNDRWQFNGTNGIYIAPQTGALNIAVNDADYSNNQGYFDLVIEVPVN